MLSRIPLASVVKVEEAFPASISGYFTVSAAMDVTVSGQTTSSVCSYNSLNVTATVDINDDTPVTLTFTNTRKLVNVTVKKIVEGEGGSFSFTALLKDGNVNCGGYTLASGVVTGSNGQAAFTLSPASNGTAQITFRIPYGTTLTLTEAEADGYTTTVKLGNGAATEARTITLSGSQTKSNQTVTFTNTFGVLAPTGYVAVTRPYEFLFLGGLLLAVLGLRGRKKRCGEAEA